MAGFTSEALAAEIAGIKPPTPGVNTIQLPGENAELNAAKVWAADLLKTEGDYASYLDTPLLSSATENIRNKKIETGAFSEGVGGLQFPSDLAAHAMVFHFKHSSMDKSEIRNAPKRTVQSISLPIPANLVDSMDTQYSEMELGTIGGVLSDTQSIGAAASTAVGMTIEAFQQGKFLGAGDTEGFKGNRGLLTLALTNMMRKKSPGVAVGLARFFGDVPNPHLTALFKGVGLKNHSFSWRLSPASARESTILQKIIQTFKRGMLPIRTNQNLTLEFPDEVDIYIRGHMNQFHMYEFKTAVIKNVTINFAPDNIPSFYAGTGAPTHVDFKVDFLETTIHTRNNYPPADMPIYADKPVEGNPLTSAMKSGARPDSMGSKGYSTTQKPKINKETASQDLGFGYKPPGAGPQGAVPGIIQGSKSLSTQAGGAFGQKTGGQKTQNPFIGKNPNL